MPGQGVFVAALGVCAACGASRVDTAAEIRYDPCTLISLAPATDALAEEIESVRDAIAMWNDAAGLDLQESSPGSATELPIRFEDAAPFFYGVYESDIGEVVINRRLEGRTQRAVTIAHELGHAFGLVHVDDRPSVMVVANLEITPTPDDVESLFAVWGECASR
jgi:hypothetical protein